MKINSISMIRYSCLVTLLLHSSTESAFAEEWKASVFVAARWNPMGLSLESDLGPKFRLYESENVLLKTNFLRPFFFFGVSPARMHSGVGAEFQPISIFGVKAFGGQAGTFGTYGHLQAFDNSHPDWSEKSREKKGETKEQKNSLQKIGNWYVIQPYLQGRVGDFGLKLSYGLQRYEFELQDGYPYFFDANDDMLLENKKWSELYAATLVCDSFQASLGVKVGVSARASKATYSVGKYRWILKTGPFIAYNWASDQTFFSALQWSPHHEIRKSSGIGGLPAIVVGHNTDWDF